MAKRRPIAIEDDDPVNRRGNDERDDRYPYGGVRNRKAAPARPADTRTRTSAASSSSRTRTAPAVKRRPVARRAAVK
jgi:hypothetical protein